MSSVPALVISARDNVATALQPLAAGQIVVMGTESVTVVEPIPKGHKMSLRLIRRGEQVMKYGSTIGTATCDIEAGAHVHTHNVASGRGRGDIGGGRIRDNMGGDELQQSVEAVDFSADKPRIAEPPDVSPITGKAAQ